MPRHWEESLLLSAKTFAEEEAFKKKVERDLDVELSIRFRRKKTQNLERN